jgi:hypothetical protein
MEEKFNYIKKRINQMEGSRGTWEDHWQEILDYVMLVIYLQLVYKAH